MKSFHEKDKLIRIGDTKLLERKTQLLNNFQPYNLARLDNKKQMNENSN